MTKKDNDDIAKDIDVLSRKLSACTDEDRDEIIKKVGKIWNNRKKGWPIEMIEYCAARIVYDFHWTQPMVHYSHNNEKALVENNEINSISDENKKKWA